MRHEVEIKKKYLDRIILQEKTFVVLKDNNYQTGDILNFQEVREDDKCRDCTVYMKVTYKQSGAGLAEDYVILGLGREGRDGGSTKAEGD